MKKILALMLVLLMAGCVFGGDEENDVIDGDGLLPDKESSERYASSADSLISAMISGGENFDIEGAMDSMSEIADLYKKAADADPANSTANFGAAVFSFMNLLEHPDMTLLEDTLQSWSENGAGNGYLEDYVVTAFEDFPFSGFEGMGGIDPGTAVMLMMYLMEGSLSQPDMISMLVDIIDNNLIATLDDAIKYMDRVALDPGFVYEITTEMTGEDTSLELDLGEVYAIGAMMRLTRSGLTILNAYQLTIPGLSGNLDIRDLTTLAGLVKAQDLNGGSFLTLRSNSKLPAAKKDIKDALAMIVAGTAFIRTESDDQSDDLIKAEDLSEADSEILDSFETGDQDNPFPVLRNVSGLADLATRLSSMLDGPFNIEIEDFDGTPTTVSMNVSAFLANGIPDFKKVLPYHEWYDLDSIPMRYDGPGIESYHEEMFGGDSVLLFVPTVMDVYYNLAGLDMAFPTQFTGRISNNGILSVSGYFDWSGGGMKTLSPGDEITADGTFYLDSQGRFSVKKEAWDFINGEIANMSTDNPVLIDVAEHAAQFPKYNFSQASPYGARSSNGYIMFSGTPEFDASDIDVLTLVDAGGNAVEGPVFPDWTFGGLLPGMTFDRWQELTGY